MPPEQLYEKLRAHPFQAFRLYLSDGTYYEVRHPEMLMVGQRAAVVGILRSDKDPPLFERTATVALLHIVRLEPVENQPQPQQ